MRTCNDCHSKCVIDGALTDVYGPLQKGRPRKQQRIRGEKCVTCGAKYRYSGARAYDATPLAQPKTIVLAVYNRDHGEFDILINGFVCGRAVSCLDAEQPIARLLADIANGDTPREIAQAWREDGEWRYEMARAELAMQLTDAQQARGVAYMNGLLVVDAVIEDERGVAA